MMCRQLLSVLAATFATCTMAATGFAAQPGDGVHILRYELDLTSDLEMKAVRGTETIRLRSTTDLKSVLFSGNALTIDSASFEGRTVPVSTAQNVVTVDLLRSLPKGKEGTLRIVYHGVPKQGVTWAPASVVTSYAACDWMICSEDAPGDKAIFDLMLHVPAGMTSVASGKLIGTRRDQNGGAIYHWRTAIPYSAYLYDFAIGKFTSAKQRQDGAELVYMSDVASVPELQTAFQETPAMVEFLSGIAGMGVPAKSYTQLLVAGDEAQEAATYSIIGKDNIDPTDDWAIIHELSHQWWGNSVTCATWKDFWLNEGFATYMTAAWKQHVRGQPGYDEEMNVARKRYEAVKAKGLDKPLAFPGEYKGRRVIQYSKGALFLDHLRALLGDETFWAGIRAYTREHAGGTVTSIDFERSMEKVSKRDLTGLFAEWVFGGSREATR